MTVLGAAVIPWVANLLYVSRLVPVPGLDLTAIAFIVSGVLIVWGTYRYGLFDLLPVAPAILVESMTDAVLMLDAQNRLVDANIVARELLLLPDPPPLGMSIDGVLASWPDVADAVHLAAARNGGAADGGVANGGLYKDASGSGPVASELLPVPPASAGSAAEHQRSDLETGPTGSQGGPVGANGDVESAGWHPEAVEVALPGEPTRYLDVRLSPVYDTRERLTGRILVLRDITVQQEIQAELSKAQQAAEAANRALAQRLVELDAANHDLQERNEELDSYAYTVAHDLKNTISHILGYASYLCSQYRNVDEETIRTGLGIIESNAARMSKVMDEMLMLARVRAGDVAAVPLDMAAIVYEAQARLAPEIRELGAIIAVPAPYAWPSALGHAAWVEEVWFNYLSNALKYGGRPPHIQMGGEPGPDGTARFWVLDNGGRLTSNDAAGLFLSGHERRAGINGQHGLGLAIVRRIVERLGGQVAVEIEEAVGSRFIFTLPSESRAPGREC